MDGIDLIGYCEIHCHTERALFVGAHVNRMIELAGNPKGFRHVDPNQFYTVKGDMERLCELARERLLNPPTCKVIQFQPRS